MYSGLKKRCPGSESVCDETLGGGFISFELIGNQIK